MERHILIEKIQLGLMIEETAIKAARVRSACEKYIVRKPAKANRVVAGFFLRIPTAERPFRGVMYDSNLAVLPDPKLKASHGCRVICNGSPVEGVVDWEGAVWYDGEERRGPNR